MKRKRWILEWGSWILLAISILLLAGLYFKSAKAEAIKEKREKISSPAISPDAAMQIFILNSNGTVVYKGFVVGKVMDAENNIYTYRFEPRGNYYVYLLISTEIYMIPDDQPDMPLPKMPLDSSGSLVAFQEDSSDAVAEMKVTRFAVR